MFEQGRRVLTACLAILFWASLVRAGAPNTFWTRTYGGPLYDRGYAVQQTSDGGYVVAGSTDSFGAGQGDFYLIKTDAGGGTLWTKTYGGTGSDYAYSVQQTSDGGYILAGYTDSFGAGYEDVYLVRTNASGGTLWTKTYGGALWDYGRAGRQTSDGGYIVAGCTYSFGAGAEDVYLVKTNASGSILWTKTYGGTSYDDGNAVQQTSDGGYIVAGTTGSFGAGGLDVYLIKTNASGGTLWTKTYGGTADDYGCAVQQTSDGGYIVAGRTSSYGEIGNIYLIRTDGSGDTLWSKTYNGGLCGYGDAVKQTSDGGYIIAGYTYGPGLEDVYLIKTNASGGIMWTKTYGDRLHDYACAVQQTSDGGYIVTGFTCSWTSADEVYLSRFGDPTAAGSISGAVSDNASGNRIVGASVYCSNGQSARTGSDGSYAIQGVPAGQYTISASASGYADAPAQTAIVNIGSQTVADFSLNPLPSEVRYVGPPQISGSSSVVLEEADAKITCGDHVHLSVPFRNEGGPAARVEVSIGQGPRSPGVPRLSFGYVPSGPYLDNIDFVLFDIGPGEQFKVNLWTYVEDLDYSERLNSAGMAPTLRMAASGAVAYSSVLLDTINFSNAAGQEDAIFLRTDCLANPSDEAIMTYAQYAAGNWDSRYPLMDPDGFKRAVDNVLRRVNGTGADGAEFFASPIAFLDSRVPDIVSLGRRGGIIGMCRHYTDFMTGLLRSLGLPTRRVYGGFPSQMDCISCSPLNAACWFGVGHAWNEVMLPGSAVWYVDATRYITGDNGLAGFKYECAYPSYALAEKVPLAHSSIFGNFDLCNVNCSGVEDCGACLDPSRVIPAPGSDCLESVFSYYNPSTGALLAASNPTSTNREVHVELSAPVSATTNSVFPLSVHVTNTSTDTLLDCAVTLSQSLDITDSGGCLLVSENPILLDALGPGEQDSVTFSVTPIRKGKTVPLTVFVTGPSVFGFGQQAISVNSVGTLPDLWVTGGACRRNQFSPGDTVNLLCSVLTNLFERATEASATAHLVSYDQAGCDTTLDLSFSQADSTYTGDLVLQPFYPAGTYVARVVASQAGFEPDSLTLSFEVAPDLQLTAEIDALTVTPDDPVHIIAHAVNRGSPVVGADVLARFSTGSCTFSLPMRAAPDTSYTSVPGPGEVEVPIGDKTVRAKEWQMGEAVDTAYSASFVLRQIFYASSGKQLCSGQWNVVVEARYEGVTTQDTLSIVVMSPDPCIRAGDLTMSPKPTVEGDYVLICCQIGNLGTASADSATTARFFADAVNSAHQIGGDIIVGDIGPGSSARVSIVWPTEGRAGFHSICVVVDRDSTSLDCDRSNNLLCDTITVHADTMHAANRMSLEANSEGSLGLLQYPNPLVAGAQIEYWVLPVPSQVNLSVYDVNGRLVRTLMAGDQTIGKHVASWDLMDQATIPVASGIYFLRLRVGDQETTRKVMVVR